MGFDVVARSPAGGRGRATVLLGPRSFGFHSLVEPCASDVAGRREMGSGTIHISRAAVVAAGGVGDVGTVGESFVVGASPAAPVRRATTTTTRVRIGDDVAAGGHRSARAPRLRAAGAWEGEACV